VLAALVLLLVVASTIVWRRGDRENTEPAARAVISITLASKSQHLVEAYVDSLLLLWMERTYVSKEFGRGGQAPRQAVNAILMSRPRTPHGWQRLAFIPKVRRLR
jgi:hypothetical protein